MAEIIEFKVKDKNKKWNGEIEVREKSNHFLLAKVSSRVMV